ncbi:MAG: hypothetical protein V8Q42_09055 [Anaerovoracaceae bacterium]
MWLFKPFWHLGAAPAAIEVTTLSDEVQKFIPGSKGMARQWNSLPTMMLRSFGHW